MQNAEILESLKALQMQIESVIRAVEMKTPDSGHAAINEPPVRTLLTSQELANAAGVSRSTIANWKKEGLKPVKTRPKDIFDLLAAQEFARERYGKGFPLNETPQQSLAKLSNALQRY